MKLPICILFHHESKLEQLQHPLFVLRTLIRSYTGIYPRSQTRRPLYLGNVTMIIPTKYLERKHCSIYSACCRPGEWQQTSLLVTDHLLQCLWSSLSNGKWIQKPDFLPSMSDGNRILKMYLISDEISENYKANWLLKPRTASQIQMHRHIRLIVSSGQFSAISELA